MATGYGSSGRYGNSYRFNPYALQSNQGSLLQFAQSNQPYIGRPVNQLADSLAKIEEGNRALVDKGSLIDMAMNSIEVDSENQDIMDQERIKMRMGVQNISESANFNTASAELNKLVSNFQRSEPVKTAVSLKQQKDQVHTDIRDMWKSGQITTDKYHKSIAANSAQKVQQDESGFYNDQYNPYMPVPLFDVPGYISDIANKIKLDQTIGVPEIEYLDPETKQHIKWWKIPSYASLDKGRLETIFKNAILSQPQAYEYLGDNVPDSYSETVDKNGNIISTEDQYIDDLVGGYAEQYKVSQDKSTFLQGNYGAKLTADYNFMLNEKALDANIVRKLKLEEEKNKLKMLQSGSMGFSSNGVPTGNVTEIPDERIGGSTMTNQISTSIDDIVENLPINNDSYSDFGGWLLNMISGTRDPKDLSHYDIVNGYLKGINDGKGIESYDRNVPEQLAELEDRLGKLKDYMQTSGSYAVSGRREDSEDARKNVAAVLFNNDIRLKPNELGGGVQDRHILMEDEKGTTYMTFDDFKTELNKGYDAKEGKGLAYSTAILSPENLYSIPNDDASFAYSRKLFVYYPDGSHKTFVISDASGGTNLNYGVRVDGNMYTGYTVNSKDQMRIVNQITGSVIGPKIMELPSIVHPNTRMEYDVVYHNNIDDDNKLQEFILKIPQAGANKALVANSPTELYTKYRIFSQIYQQELKEAQTNDPTKTSLNASEINAVFDLYNSLGTGYTVNAEE